MKVQVVAAFAAIYLIWGSTYLAIRFVIETIPPFFMAGTRFIIAGLILYLWTQLHSPSSKASVSHWGRAFVVAGLMLLGGHGAVVWAEQWVPSGLTALLIATVPLWMVCLDWLQGSVKPRRRVIGGVVLGFAGVALLIGGVESLGESYVDLAGGTVLVLGAFFWASGSLYSRSAHLPSSPLLATSVEMMAGGLLLLVASIVTGEWVRVRLDQVSARSLLSWVYLIVFGALVAFTSYIWLLKVTTPARVSTYAYVNPIVAMFLGWALANEPLTFRSLIAAAIILISVIVIITYETHMGHSKKLKR